MKTGKKIIFLSFVIKPWHFEKFYFIDHLIANGFEIEFWDMSTVFKVDIGRIADPTHVRKLESRSSVRELIKNNQFATFVLLFALEYRFLWIYRLLTEHKCKLFFFSSGHFPSIKKNIFHEILDVMNNPKNIYKKIVLSAVNRMKMVKNFDVVLFDANRAKEKSPGANQYVAINSLEFETYCDLSSASTSTQAFEGIPYQKYIVFLDSCLPFNSDPKRNGYQNVDPERYRIGITNLFDQLEHNLGIKVIIAAHPKSEYSSEYFENRPIIKWKTAQLVMRANFVISHYSTATNYAVLWKKPIIFICSDDFSRIPRARYRMLITSGMAKELNMPLYNMDHLPEKISFSDVNDKVYDQYREKYVTLNTSCEKRNKDIILAAFLGIK